MTLQIFNDKGSLVLKTEHKSCIPDDDQLSSMHSIGYKFKIDGKAVSIKKVKELRGSK